MRRIWIDVCCSLKGSEEGVGHHSRHEEHSGTFRYVIIACRSTRTLSLLSEMESMERSGCSNRSKAASDLWGFPVSTSKCGLPLAHLFGKQIQPQKSQNPTQISLLLLATFLPFWTTCIPLQQRQQTVHLVQQLKHLGRKYSPDSQMFIVTRIQFASPVLQSWRQQICITNLTR